MANAAVAQTDFNASCPCPDASRLVSTVKPTFVLMSGRIVAFAATFLVPVVLARVLTPAEFGTYKQIFLVYATLYYIAQFGVAESLFYFVPAAPHDGGRFVANAMVCLALTGGVCLVMLDTGGGRLADWLNNADVAPLAALAGVLLLLMLVSSVFEIAMITRGRYLLASATYGVSDLLRAGFLIVPAAIAGGVRAVLIGAVVFAALRLACAAAYVAAVFRRRIRPDAAALRDQLRYTLPFGLATVIEICQANLHLFAVSWYVDAATFAVYAVGCLQIPLVDLVATSAGNVLMVQMGDDVRRARPAAGLPLWRDTVGHLAMVLVPLVGLLMVAAPAVIVVLFTEQYAAATPVFLVWSLAILPAVFPADAVLRVHAQTRFLLLLNAIRFGAIAVLIAGAIAAWHLTGAVAVTLAAAVLTKAIALWRVAAVMRVRPAALVPWGLLARILAAAAVAAMPAHLLLATIAPPGPIALALAGLAYAGAYLVLLGIFGVMTVSTLCVALRASSV
jgi:O-antigen/teichoic acid export membrane protein